MFPGVWTVIIATTSTKTKRQKHQVKSYKWHGMLPDKKTKKASSSQPCCGVKVHIPELKSQPLNLTARIMVAGVTVLDCNSELKIGHIPVSRRGCQLPFFTTLLKFLLEKLSQMPESSVKTVCRPVQTRKNMPWLCLLAAYFFVLAYAWSFSIRVPKLLLIVILAIEEWMLKNFHLQAQVQPLKFWGWI